MSDLGAGRPERIASVADQLNAIALEAPATTIHFLGEEAVFVGSESACTLVAPDGTPQPAAVADGAILCTVSDGTRVVLGCDDGRVLALDATGAV
ncbi:MAG: WD40 repeat domain-containing protein, partial [Xanthobacteraceae bacterium]